MMDYGQYSLMVGTLFLLLALMYGAVFLLKKLKIPMFNQKTGQNLRISEQMMIDNKRKLLVVHHDGQEVMVLLSPTGDVLLPLGHGYRNKMERQAVRSAKKNRKPAFRGGFSQLVEGKND